MNQLIKKIQGLPQFQALLENINNAGIQSGLSLPRAARLPLLSALYNELDRVVLLITDRADHAINLFDELAFWVGNNSRFHFADPNPLFYEKAPWGINTRRERLRSLTCLARYHLQNEKLPEKPPIIVTSARSLITKTLPLQEFINACVRLSIGKSYQLEPLLRSLIRIGYQFVDTVLETGQISHRGGLIDVWPLSEPQPARLDFFGDVIESIRQFDPTSQRTISTVDSMLITPAREFLRPDEADQYDQTTELSEFHIPLLHTNAATLLDYLTEDALILVDDVSLASSVINEIEEQALKDRSESISDTQITTDFPIPYLTWSEIEDTIHSSSWLELGGYAQGYRDNNSINADLASNFGHDERFGGRLKLFIDYLLELVKKGEQVIVVSRQSSRLKDLWGEKWDKETHSNLTFLDGALSEGFVLNDSQSNFHLITDSEIFGWERPQPRLRQGQIVEAPEALYSDLVDGDFVVHIDYGIGQFKGLVQKQLEGQEREFLAVEYDRGDILYIPIHQADRMTRYIGPDGGTPALNNMGGQGWQESKGKVKAAVKKMAEELLELYAYRHIAQGHAFSKDSNWQTELEDSFPYVETDDQIKVISEIKRDMERHRPMDRLLCGDVGYGKTEVAVRVAFKAVMDGKQVAMLVPTTVLAQQHYDTFCQRLAAFPVKVEMLSRFRTHREQSEILLSMAFGEIDIVIGTHRLISSDVQFKDLGLVIIDEEQRFGVTHKEHLKKLRTQVDVLTLTATPIPRTLYMALTGVRDISYLNTPPAERLPIITHVGPYSPKLVKQAVIRELERGGQIFFVHNRVRTINAIQNHLKSLVPDARIGVAHGQMPEHELASVMRMFTSGKIDILLSTSIIESGLDIPNANTLIVDRADTFGLAQLYQLRGRVGRGAMRAYSYFFRHRKLAPTIEGQQRLEVIAENTQLGSGYSIAMRDLEIRGAGDLLGSRQHGYIATVGFHLYTRLLADSVRRIRADDGKQVPNSNPTFDAMNLPLAMPVNVDLPIAVGIPTKYISDQNLRLRLYRRIADVRDESEIDALMSEFKDRFGEIPEMLDNLFYQMRVKLLAEKIGLASINMENNNIVLRYPKTLGDEKPPHLLDLGPATRTGKDSYWLTFGREPNWPQRLLEVLSKIVEPGSIVENNK
ncbi:MAG: transcription-repair coupling factor [Anaerolineae bacterium]|nr:transcription-repair coupling factor [Anaerolineae bacterium]